MTASAYGRLTPRMAWQLAAPHTWPAAILPVLVAAAAAAVTSFSISATMVCVLLVICVLMQSAVNTFNDYYDYVKGADSADDNVDPTDAVLVYNNVNPRAALALAVGFLAAAFLLGLVGPGVFLLPALSALQGFFLSYSVACFAAALGRGGVKLALCAFGVRCAFILPCTFFLAAWGMRAAYARLRGPKKRRAPLTGADRTRLALCALLLAAGVFAELTAVPKLLQLGLAAIT